MNTAAATRECVGVDLCSHENQTEGCDTITMMNLWSNSKSIHNVKGSGSWLTLLFLRLRRLSMELRRHGNRAAYIFYSRMIRLQKQLPLSYGVEFAVEIGFKVPGLRWSQGQHASVGQVLHGQSLSTRYQPWPASYPSSRERMLLTCSQSRAIAYWLTITIARS